MLDNRDIELLLNLQAYPLASASFIAEKINMSISGTIDRINRLIEEEKAFQSVLVNLNLPALGLEMHDFFFKINSLKSLKILEEIFCIEHPYVAYRARCNGCFSSIYIQFRCPNNGLKLLLEIAELLGKKGIIQYYEYVKRDTEEKPIRIKSALSSWEPISNTWKFNWEEWRKGYFINNTNSNKSEPVTGTILKQLDKLDIQLLSELTLDGRRKNTTMMKNLGIKNEPGVKQKVGRRVKFLKENAIIDYNISLNSTVFDLYQTVIFRGNCGVDIARKLRNYHINNQNKYQESLMNEVDKSTNINIFPFSGYFFITDNGFLWYIRAPPSHLSQLTDFMLEICPQHNFFVVDHKYTKRYGLWHQTFDAEKKEWKIAKEFMIDSVMEKVNEAL